MLPRHHRPIGFTPGGPEVTALRQRLGRIGNDGGMDRNDLTVLHTPEGIGAQDHHSFY